MDIYVSSDKLDEAVVARIGRVARDEPFGEDCRHDVRETGARLEFTRRSHGLPEEEAFDREHISADLFGQSAGQLVQEQRSALPEGCYLVRGFLPAAGEDSEVEDEIAVLEKVTAGDKICSVRGVGADERGFALSESGASPTGCYVKLAVQDVDEFGFLVAVLDDGAEMVRAVSEHENRKFFVNEIEAVYFGADGERAVLLPMSHADQFHHHPF